MTQPATAVAAPSQGTAAQTARLHDSANQFEAFLLSEMLKCMQMPEDEDEDQSGSALSEMAGQQFAQALAASGGLGISKLVLKQLAPVS